MANRMGCARDRQRPIRVVPSLVNKQDCGRRRNAETVMRRQRLRRALILISFVSFPITLFYFSPVLIIMAAHEGVIAGCFIVFAL